jgi:ACS family allantoate permease-like MFS transporter
LAFNIVAWGIAQCCHAAVFNYSGIVAARFFLGVFESAVTPGFALMTAQVRRRSSTNDPVVW